MPADDVLPWTLLLSKLRRSDDARVSYAEVMAAGAEPVLCVRERVLEYGKDDDYEPPDCERGCLPNLNYNLRASEKLVGVACPEEPPCWPGWKWVERTEVEGLRCRAKDVFAKLAARNGLTLLTGKVPKPFLGVGLVRRRGLNVAVVWLRAPKLGFEQLCRGTRAELGVDGMIVLVAKKPPTALTAVDRIVPFELALDARGGMDLARALEELTPEYRTRVIEDPMLDLDYVRLRLATRPGDRHVVEINGHDFGGFRKSDLKFLRLLLLAAARRNGKDDGWIDKSRLRDGSDKDPALHDLRADLGKFDVPGLGEEERKALLRVQRGEGLVRLGIPPENIELDESLAQLEFVATTTTTKKDGTKGKATKKQEEGLQNAATLLRDCRRLGAPGEAEAVKTPATSRRASRGGT
ncbi:hypothetical protein NVS55_08415 [Myxococcus stipitatus]|uniref:hypothetical protein n=1 Tax=Myxococcus stipitatus TaxID=83455 RepID=UPI0031450A7D